MLCAGEVFSSMVTEPVSKCLQISISVSTDTVYRYQPASKNKSLRGKAFAKSFPTNGPYVTILAERFLPQCFLCEVWRTVVIRDGGRSVLFAR
jgi:hypothetical protein